MRDAIPMDGLGNIADNPLSSSNWEVYKDSFAPLPPRRRIKAWERAPVAAHAPRLQGQKIWKKIGVRSHNNKENDETAQMELEKGGLGSRKRPRVLGAKENIGNAHWLDAGEGDLVEDTNEKPRILTAAKETNTLQAISRKRKNTDRVATPRKSSRISALNQDSGPSPKKHPETPEKPFRRRKSLRQSTRRLTIVPSDIDSTNMQPLKKKPEIPPPDMSPEKSENITPEISLEETWAIPKAVDPVIDDIEQAATEEISNSYSTELILKTLPAASPSEMVQPLDDEESESERTQEFTVADSLPVQDGRHLSVVDSSEIVDSSSNVTTNLVSLDDEGASEQDGVSSQILQSWVENVTDPILEANQGDENPAHEGEFLIHDVPEDISSSIEDSSRWVETPKPRRRMGQRRGVRRSIRTCSSSSHNEDNTPNEVAVPEPTTPGSVNVALSFTSPVVDDVSPSENEADPVLELTNPTSNIPGVNEERPCDDSLARACQAETPSPMRRTEKTVGSDEAQLESEESVPNAEPTEASGDIPENAEIQPISKQEATETLLVVAPNEIESEVIAGKASNRNAMGEGATDQTSYLAPSLEGNLTSLIGSQEQTVHHSSPLPLSVATTVYEAHSNETTPETLEVLEPISMPLPIIESLIQARTDAYDTSFDVSNPTSTTGESEEKASPNKSLPTYDDETDMLRSFLSRVKADKAAKAETTGSKRKRSLPHSPLQLPLGEVLGAADSPSSPKAKDEFDVSLPSASPSKRRKRNVPPPEDEDITEPRSIRRSGRTRLPIKKPLAAPSLIPFRRIGQEGDNTINLRRNEEKELAALTRVNTRKNKGGALCPADVLAKKGEEKDDPASRQRHLKEIFDEKTQKKKQTKKGKSVVWAEELAHFQSADGKKVELEKDAKDPRINEKQIEKLKPIEDKKSSIPRVGMKSKIARGVAANGTPVRVRKAK